MNALVYKVCFLIVVLIIISCKNQSDQTSVATDQSEISLNLETIKLPPPIAAKYIDPDSVQAPVVVPLKGKPKVVPAHANEYAPGKPKDTQVPMNLIERTIGKDIPPPIIEPAKWKVVEALQPKPKPVKAFRTKAGAIYDLQFLSDVQGIYTNVKYMLEDSRGHFWFGNSGYLARYDGINFFVYSEKEGFLKGGAISIMEDSKGNLWFAGDAGLCYYDGTNVVHFNQETGLASDACRALKEDSKGNVWFGNGSKNVYSFDGENFTVFNEQHRLSNDSQKERGYFSDNRIVDIEEDGDGNIWMATQGSGVLRYDGRQFTHFTEDEGLVHNYIAEILVDNDNQLWFGSGGQGIPRGLGVSRYNSKKGANGTFSNFTTKEGLSGNRITGLAKDKTGNIWMATYDGGLTKFDSYANNANGYQGKGKFTHYTPDEGLSFETALCVIVDADDNIWVGTNGGGISRLQPNSFRQFTEQQGLSQNWASPLLEDSQGNIWMGTMYSGAIKYDGINFTHYTEKEGLLQNSIQEIIEDKNGNLWFATRDKGICRFDGKTFSYYSTDQGLSGVFVWDLQVDGEGNIWIACGWAGGVNRLDPIKGQITHYKGKQEYGIGGGSIFQDSEQDLWFGGQGLLAKFDGEKDALIFRYNIDPLENEWIDLSVEDDKKNLWFGTPSIFVQVKKEGTEIEDDLPRITTGGGLPNTRIGSIVIDNNQNVWVGGGDNGIAVLKKGSGDFGQMDAPWLHYNKADGLIPGHFSSSLLDGKNRLWWGSLYGITQLNLNRFQLPYLAPKSPSISHIDVKGKFIDYQNLDDESYQNTLGFGARVHESFDSVVAFHNYPRNLNLPYDLNHLTFHFSAIDWVAPNQIQYSYQMEGLEDTWSEPSVEAKADYRNLPHGTYTFKVKSKGEAHVWTEPFEYAFTIRAPWWHTWWAYGLYGLLALSAFGGYIMRLRYKIKEKQEQLEREQYLNRELRELNIATTRFVPSDFVQILNKDALKELKLGDQTQATMTVLFADIRDYTSLSESMTPAENFKFINAYLGRMGPIIQAHGGFICQYFGDGIMALFKENHDQAVKAAIEMQQALQSYNRKRFAHNRPAIEIGIGLNTGQLMLGVIGDEQRYDTSVISDAVNTASRMEGLTKIFGCKVIVSEKTLQELQFTEDESSDTLGGNYRFLGKVKVKGKDHVLKIYDFYDADTEEVRELKTSTKPLFEKALQLYYKREFGKSADALKVIVEKIPGDVAANYYMDKCVKYIMDGVDKSWSGVEMMVSK